MERLRAIMRENVGSAFPGAAFALIRPDLIEIDCVGDGNIDTLYDVASLTKVIVTNTLVGLTVQEGRLDLDDRLCSYMPEYSNLDVVEDIYAPLTIRSLLCHQSALSLPNIKDELTALCKDGRYEQAHQKSLDNLQNTYIDEELLEYKDSAISKHVSYANINFILLGMLIERLYEKPLDVLAWQKVFEPLGMASSHFNHVGEMIEPERYSPTEMTEWRGLVQGYVHDENAFFLGGVAGHAGLFSNIEDVSCFAQMVLNRGKAGSRQFISNEVVSQWFEPQNEKRTIGFELRGSAIMHTGFTGTAILIGKDIDLAVVILSNRVRYGRENRKIYDMYEEVWKTRLQTASE